MKKLCFTAILFSLFFSSCQEDTVVEKKDYPYVITKEIEVSESGAILNGELNKFGNEILMYGFVWSENPLPTINDNIIEFYDSPDKEFSYNIHAALIEGENYYVRTYAQSEEYLVYGNQMNFNSMGSLPPTITSFTPEFGSIGTVVEITGENFSNSLNGNIVKFGEINATIVSVSETKIYVTVPLISESLKDKIYIETANMTGESTKEFDIQHPWTRKGNFNMDQLSNPCSFTIGNKGYLCLGYSNNSNSYSNQLWEYDPEYDSWTRKADFPGKSAPFPVAFTISNKAYIYIRYTNNSNSTQEKATFWEYSQENDQWTKKTEFLGSNTNYSIGFSINGKGYVGPGDYAKDFWEYNPETDVWIKKTDFPGSERANALGFSIGEFGYVGMGTGYSNWPNKDFYRYDSKNDKWELMEAYPGNGGNFLNGKSINGLGYVGLGINYYNKYGRDFWKYSPENDTWTELTPFPFPTFFEVDLVVNEKMYFVIASNNDDSFFREFVYEYDPSRD